MEKDRYGYVEFVDMQSMPVLFNEKPSFSELVVRAREELHCHDDDGIAVEGVLHLGSPPNILRKMIPIGCADQWENYMRSAMKSQFQSLDVVVRRVVLDSIPHGFSPEMSQQAHFTCQQTQHIHSDIFPRCLHDICSLGCPSISYTNPNTFRLVQITCQQLHTR